MREDGAAQPTGLTKHDLEMAARYAEQRAHDLREEAANANSSYARRSISKDAAAHEARALRYRRAIGKPPKSTGRSEAAEALETLRDYLRTTPDPDLINALTDLNRLARRNTDRPEPARIAV